MEWIKGEPPEATWCLVVYLSNDEPPMECVEYLWFNPDAINKWYIGNAGKSIPFNQPVTHYMYKPKPPKTNLTHTAPDQCPPCADSDKGSSERGTGG